MRIAITILMLLSSMSLKAEIINGYTRIDDSKRSHESLTKLMNDESVKGPRRAGVKVMLRQTEEYIELYEMTEQLLQDFKRISPELYSEIENIRDEKGRPVDVYVKMIKSGEFRDGFSGLTNVDFVKGDSSAYLSEYGENTVSVKVAVTSNSLEVLAHEFGHVSYQVPNIREYYPWYFTMYKTFTYKKYDTGHSSIDPSGIMADEFVDRFRQYRKAYFKTNNP